MSIFFSKISALSSGESLVIIQNMCVKFFKKGAFLLKFGQMSMDTYFILEGCLREYLVIEGEEKTTNFFFEEQWVISLNNFGPQNASTN